MMQILATALSAVLMLIALIHAYWGAGGTWPATSAYDLARTVVGARGIEHMPPPASCFVVAMALFAIAIWPLIAGGIFALPVAAWLVQFAGVGITLVFLLRGVVPYTVAWRRIWPEQPFARLDRQIYGPLCLTLGLGCLALLMTGIHP